MTISRTYAELQHQIADELGDRQDLLDPLSDSSLTYSPIVSAIQSAIAKWEREKFYFNEYLQVTPIGGTSPWNTVANQEYYDDDDWTDPTLTSVAKIDKMWVLINSNRYSLVCRTEQYLNDIAVSPSTQSFPTDYSYQAGTLRMYPIPSGAWPVGIVGIQRLDDLSDDNDTNSWTTEGFDLIRCEAKLMLARDTLYDQEIYASAYRAIYGDPSNPSDRGYLFALKGESTRKSGGSRIRPSYF